MIIDARKMLSNNHATGDCAICGGDSAEGIPVKKAVSGSFTDWQALIAAQGKTCCPECRRIIATSQMRTKCVLCVDDGDIRFVKYQDVFDVIQNPPERFVVSVPYSFKRHHWLYAGISSPERMEIGTDTGTVEYIHSKHSAVLDAIIKMIEAGVSSIQIESGNYRPGSIALLGSVFQELENVIAGYRGSGLVRLLCKIAPKDKNDQWRMEDMRTNEQSNAALYLLTLAKCSNFRVDNGLQFWGGFFEARINRVVDLPFDEATNKLMESLHCVANSGIANLIDQFDDKRKNEVMNTLRTQGKLVVSLAYSDLKKERS